MTTNLKDKGKTPKCKLVRLRIWSNKSNLITSFTVHASKIILQLGLLREVFERNLSNSRYMNLEFWAIDILSDVNNANLLVALQNISVTLDSWIAVV